MQRGFTLIEVLITLAIASILSSIALPSYSAYVLRAHRFEGVLALQQLMLRQEQWRVDHPHYAQSADQLRAPASARYRFEVQDADERGYTLVAQAVGAQARDTDCATLRLVVQGGAVHYQHQGSAAAGRCWGR
jgi:type IV pilus assembly protein PilE